MIKAIRHPNIFNFLGGGRYHDDGCPFLVVECMPRGSLTNGKTKVKISLEDNVKLKFAVTQQSECDFYHSQRQIDFIVI